VAGKGELGAAEERYLVRLVDRVRTALGGDLVGAYVIGSGALGDFTPGLSDLDVAVVTRGSLDRSSKARLAERLSHATFTCPARRLELVVYSTERLLSPEPWRFELNLNTGAGEADHVAFDLAEEPPHWFVLDLDQARAQARTLAGPGPPDVFPPIPSSAVRDALSRSFDWHLAHDEDGVQTVLNACRAWRWLDEGVWCSKRAAGSWARERLERPEVVDRALAVRYRGAPEQLPRAEVEMLVAVVRSRLRAFPAETLGTESR
jgi:hypothetical protein